MCTSKDQIEILILKALTESERIDSFEFSNDNKLDHNDTVSCLRSLEDRKRICAKVVKKTTVSLTKNGENILANGSPEFLVFAEIPLKGIFRKDLEEKLGGLITGLGVSQCMKQKICKIEKNAGGLYLTKKEDLCLKTDQLRLDLSKLVKADFDFGVFGKESKQMQLITKRRKLLESKTKSSLVFTKGEFYDAEKEIRSTLTPEMIKSGNWKNISFKKYNFEAKGIPISFGALHPLMKVREEFRSVLIEMGFKELETNQFVESSFWNFDALFQPQQHPSRDAHDTFFLERPLASKLDEADDYINEVKKTHEHGGKCKSKGWRYPWSISEASKNILRTHTTASSAKTLRALANKNDFPQKYFSIDRVFRNETLDATHLAEFHQVEGFVADYNLSLSNLIGIVSSFFRRIGIEKMRFKPAYNPYTEPSMEIFGYSNELGKWIEVGNSGIFRPEMLEPMGIDPEIQVLAWGLSLERPTMIKYGISNIRDLFGHKVDLSVIQSNPEVML